MGALTRFIQRTRRLPVDTFKLSTSTTKVFFDIAIDNQPAGRIVFKVYDDLEQWTSPWSTSFLKLAESGQDKSAGRMNFIGSEFQRCGQGRGEATCFSTTGKSATDLFEMRKLWDFMLNEYAYVGEVEGDNPLVHDREGLLTAVTHVPERYLRKNDFIRQLISAPNDHADTMFGITYDPYPRMDGKFAVIGEILEGWDALIEIECACVQPLSYYYPNNQHLISLAEQTGMDQDPAFIERIAMGLQTDTYVEGHRDAQLAIDSGEFFQEPSDARSKAEDGELVRKSKQSEMYEDIPIAVRPALESAETAEIREREKWEAWDKKSQLDFHTINKSQAYLSMEKRNELINNPSIGPGPMTASATITNSGILKQDRNFISASLKNLLSSG